jgi:dTDP-4-amino-4,6-dideoxygalactose transaminase
MTIGVCTGGSGRPVSTSDKQPAILGGAPAFPDGIPYTRPLVPPLDACVGRLEASFANGQLTNGRLVREFEERMADRLGVPHAVAVNSCTAGLMLALRALAPEGKALMPSFTFSATAHAASWNGLEPVFAECDPDSFQLDPDAAADQLDDVGVIVATHVFGTPSPTDRIEALAAKAGIPVLFDAAAALGAVHRGRPVGSFGDAEVFSLSPTKPVIAGEGGVVATARPDVAESVRIGRDYGNPGDYDTRFVGLNARMSELHAAMALESLDRLDEHLELRHALADRYRAALDGLPGIRVQSVADGDRPTYKDFSIVIDPEVFGLGREDLARALRADGIDTRTYFSPPVHRQKAYRDIAPAELPVTESVAARVLNLPLFAALALETVDQITEVMASAHRHADAILAPIPSPT